MRRAFVWVGARTVPVLVSVFVVSEGAASYWVASATGASAHEHLVRWLPAVTAAAFSSVVLAVVALGHGKAGGADMDRLARGGRESFGTTISHVRLLDGPVVALAPVPRAPMPAVAPLRPRQVPGVPGVPGVPAYPVGVRVSSAGCRNVTVT
jgi:hypothetical protein